MEEFHCDILHVTENRESVLKKLDAKLSELCKNVLCENEKTTVLETECITEQAKHENTILNLQNEIKAIQSEIDETKLQQKVTNKKLQSLVKQEEDLQIEIRNAKDEKETLSLEMVDVQEAAEQRIRKKQAQWDSLKKAFNVYKEKLDIHIKLVESQSDNKCIKVSFFINGNTSTDGYYAYLCQSNDTWEVKQTQPTLRAEHLDIIKSITNETAFLCHIREIFMKYYMNEKQ